jgi:hypothetical protein
MITIKVVRRWRGSAPNAMLRLHKIRHDHNS